jgi:hypothetical protein
MMYRDETKLAISEAGTAYPSGAPEFIPVFWWDSCYSIFSFKCVSFVDCCLSFFLLAIVLSVLLQFTYSDLPL